MKTPMKYVVAVMATITATPLFAQTPTLPATSDPALFTARLSNQTLPVWLMKSAEAMSEADFAFKPTPEVRSFGQVLAHIADRDYWFCSAVKGEKAPVRDIEKTKTSKADIQKALSEAFEYCDAVYAGMTEDTGRKIVQFGGMPMPALSVLLFRTHHGSLHYGNIVTYMRLRGKVPPSTASTSPISKE